MKDRYPKVIVLFLLLTAVHFGCGPKQVQSPPVSSEVTCIQGNVWYRNPIDSTQAAYPNATVTAWRRDSDQPLVETRADQKGRYCIEVPVGDYTVDLRVWGLERFEAKNYVCQGSSVNIALGTTPGRCGGGDCIKTDILTDCKERLERRRGK